MQRRRKYDKIIGYHSSMRSLPTTGLSGYYMPKKQGATDRLAPQTLNSTNYTVVHFPPSKPPWVVSNWARNWMSYFAVWWSLVGRDQ